uniref:Uncharacterized protein n=1 Tax=Lutzomyia longipalpis TaxID=7200 RepID=A0A1B0GHL7_LUTLO
MGVRADPGSFRWCQALSRSRSIATTRSSCEWTLLCLITLTLVAGTTSNTNLAAQQDAVHITAILGESVVFNCHVEFPGDHPVPYVLQWEKKVSETVRYRILLCSLNQIFIIKTAGTRSLHFVNVQFTKSKKT